MDVPKININDLPNEILLEIFSYIPIDELAVNVQSVCVLWSELGSHNVLWENSLFRVGDKTPLDYIISVFQKSPKLESFHTDSHSPIVLHKLSQYCKNIKKLVVANHGPREDTLQALQNIVKECTKLEDLTIAHVAGVFEEVGDLVAQCKNLRSLCLVTFMLEQKYYCIFSIDTPVTLKAVADGCQLLQRLDVDCGWYYADMKYLLEERGKMLVSLRTWHSNIRGNCIMPLLAQCQNNLRELWLEGNCRGCPLIGNLKTFPNLTSLKVLVPSKIDDALENLFKEQAMSHLLELELEGPPGLTSSLVQTVCSNCPNLLTLRLRSARVLHDDGLQYLYKCSKLTELELHDCEKFTAAAMDYVSKCSNLRCLKIKDCAQISQGFIRLIDLTELTHLVILHCAIDVLPLELLPEHLKKLRKLTLSLGWKHDVNAINALRAKMSNLRVDIC